MLLFSFLFALIQVPTTSCNDDPSYTNCSTTIRCGSIQNLGYPFWGMNRASYCGQPEFNLSCQDDVAKITMDRITFRVLDANPTDQTLTVARDDYWNGYCPEELMNTTINYNKFEYGGSLRNLTLFYGCSSPSIYNCDKNGAVLYATGSFLGDLNLYLCRRNVIVPVYEKAALNLDMNLLTLNDALRGGFELQWVVDNEQCRKCMASDGACGYNQTTDRFVCFRRDQLSQTTFSQTQAPTSVHADDGNISSCSARLSCGDLKNIGYPFWGLDRPESCGHPAFKLNCSGDIPTIVINSATYRVLKIGSSSRDLEVARDDYFDNICPTYLINSTFNPTLFELNRNSQDINLYYGCLSPIPSVVNPMPTGISGQFDCTINKTENIVGYFVTRNFESFGAFAPTLSSFFGTCNHNVIIPLLSSEIESLEKNPNSNNLNEALKDGFELQWFADDSLCNSCEDSGGQCGHNISTGEFRCYCSDGAFPNTCSTGSPASGDKKDKKDIPLIAGLGIAGAVVAGILLGMGILRYRQKRKKIADQIKSRDLLKSPSTKDLLSTSTTNLSQSIPSYPTSNYDLERGSTYFGAHVFSYEELEAATDNFDPSKQLGEGGFGIVYFGVLHDGRVVAVKRLFENNFKRVEQYMNEIEILTKIRHVNLVTLYGCTSRRSRELLLVYEYIPNGTVADHLHGKFSKTSLLPWTVRLNIAIETANGLAYLHAKDIIHRDVKTNNILLDNNFHVKVADFGLSRLFPNDVTHVSTAPQGTPGYVDPEYFQCYQLTEKSDVYSFGVVLAELVSAKQAVDTSRHRLDINLANMAVSRIQNHALHELVDPSLGFETDNEVKSSVTAVSGLAFRCLQQEREMRPSMEEVLECLKGIQNPNLGAQKAEVLDINSEAEVVDIGSDDVGLLKNLPPPLSPDSVNEKWMQVRSM